MKSYSRSWWRGLIVLWAGLSFGGVDSVRAQEAPAAAPQQAPAAAQPATDQAAQASAAPAANPAPPPSEAPKRSQEDLEKLAAPIALYPDPLIANVLPASAYPLEVVEAARFVKDTNNVAKLDEQKWDENVKAVARFPEVISQMDQNIGWTTDLGDAFINQPKDLMNAIQTMRTKAEESGALKTTEQQVVTTTNTVVTNTVQNEIVYVTNEVVQIQPAQPDVVYVPQYNPTVVYPSYPVAYPGYTYPPARPLVGTALTFGAGMAVGAWLGGGCDWNDGGCWGGGNYHSDVNVNRNVNYNNNVNVNRNNNYNNNNNNNYNKNNNNNNNRQNANNNNNGQKWQPDQNRMKNSGSSMSSAQNREARGYSTGSAQGANGTATGNAANRANAANGANASAASANGANRANAGTASANAANRQNAGAGTAGANAGTANAVNRANAGAGTANAGAGTANANAGNGKCREPRKRRCRDSECSEWCKGGYGHRGRRQRRSGSRHTALHRE